MLKPKVAIVSVINDLVTDKRVDKTCKTLVKLGFEVTLVGRRKVDSQKLEKRQYHAYRMNLLFEKGPLFYLEFNIRLLFYLLGNKADFLFSNDLDTLLPNFLIHKVKRIPLVYDSHEYFTGVPELVNRNFVRKTWKIIEKSIFPKLHDVITVNQSIADLYESEYRKKVHIVRNIPDTPELPVLKSKAELGIPENQRIIIFQGAGINVDRGGEELVVSMKYLDGVLLLIIGGGDVIDVLKKLSFEHGVTEKIRFLPKQTFANLFQYTSVAEIGLTLDKDTNINYRFSLPNKLFDYIHAGVPVLASRLPEIKKIIDQYQVGEFIESHDPEHIALKIREMLNDRNKLDIYRDHCKIAAKNLSWESEEKILLEILAKYA